MRVLVVCRYKEKLSGYAAPFVIAQAEAIADAGCEVELFRLRGNYWKQWKSLRAKIREFMPDVIHAHYGLTCLVANLATRRVLVVSTYHGSDINVKSVLLFSKLAIRLSAWNIFVSRKNMAIANAEEGKKCSLVPCGVELSDDQLQFRGEARIKLGWQPTDKKILFSGAFDNSIKDPDLAKKTVTLLDGVELLELKGYSREQVNTMMCAANCLLMTSRTEGSPQVIKEAMACGCPIVSVDVGDVKERTEGVDGCYVVPIGDRSLVIGNLEEALKKAIAFEGKTNGREYILREGLSNPQVAERIIKIYNKILR